MTKIIDFFRSRSVSEHRFSELVRPHVGSMYRMAYRWTQNREDSEDLVQETLAKLVNRVDEMERVEKLGPWLIKVLYRSFIDFHRKQARSPGQGEAGRQADVSLFDEQTLQTSEDENFVKRLGLQRELVRALETLNDEQRDVVLLHDTEGYSAAEVGEILDVSIGTVKSRLHRARSQLKKILEQGTF